MWRIFLVSFFTVLLFQGVAFGNFGVPTPDETLIQIPQSYYDTLKAEERQIKVILMEFQITLVTIDALQKENTLLKSLLDVAAIALVNKMEEASTTNMQQEEN